MLTVIKAVLLVFSFFLSWLSVAQNALFVVLKRGTSFRNLLIKVRVFLELGEDGNGVGISRRCFQRFPVD